MAKYKVEQFSSAIKNNKNGKPNLFILCKLLNSSNNPATREYQISPDERFPDLAELNALVTGGFDQAKTTGAKVEISEYKERFYLFLTLPGVNDGQSIQVSGSQV
ncbi:hypothetical protein [Pseudomonas helleri]|uniref:Uncharacterized protein n=1 Tax=Pseudomonas helleri TaxID=1608996 RepID=A0A7X2BS92_9PSED|nr:hypothetical protein [Pseudomonas helleri]MQT73330.1 hypothetical protein [Pseudomonas helleri]